MHPCNQMKRRQKQQKAKTQTTNMTKENDENTMFPTIDAPGALQQRSKGTSSVAYEVLIIKFEIDFINLSIFNCLTSNIDLFIFNYLASKFYFPNNIFFASRRERLFMDARR